MEKSALPEVDMWIRRKSSLFVSSISLKQQLRELGAYVASTESSDVLPVCGVSDLNREVVERRIQQLGWEIKTDYTPSLVSCSRCYGMGSYKTQTRFRKIFYRPMLERFGQEYYQVSNMIKHDCTWCSGTGQVFG